MKSESNTNFLSMNNLKGEKLIYLEKNSEKFANILWMAINANRRSKLAFSGGTSDFKTVLEQAKTEQVVIITQSYKEMENAISHYELKQNPLVSNI